MDPMGYVSILSEFNLIGSTIKAVDKRYFRRGGGVCVFQPVLSSFGEKWV